MGQKTDELNDRALEIRSSAERRYKTAVNKLNTKNKELKNSIETVETIEQKGVNSLKEFVKYYDYVKHIVLQDSKFNDIYSQIKLSNHIEVHIQKLIDLDEKNAEGKVAGWASGAAITGLSMAMGASLASGLFIAAVPALAIKKSITQYSNAKKNLEMAQEYSAQVNECVEDININITKCQAIIEYMGMVDNLLDVLCRIFGNCVDAMGQMVTRKTEGFKKEIERESLSEDDIKLLAITRAIAGAIKAVVDAPLLNENNTCNITTQLLCNKTTQALPQYEKESYVSYVCKFDYYKEDFEIYKDNRSQIKYLLEKVSKEINDDYIPQAIKNEGNALYKEVLAEARRLDENYVQGLLEGYTEWSYSDCGTNIDIISADDILQDVKTNAIGILKNRMNDINDRYYSHAHNIMKDANISELFVLLDEVKRYDMGYQIREKIIADIYVTAWNYWHILPLSERGVFKDDYKRIAATYKNGYKGVKGDVAKNLNDSRMLIGKATPEHTICNIMALIVVPLIALLFMKKWEFGLVIGSVIASVILFTDYNVKQYKIQRYIINVLLSISFLAFFVINSNIISSSVFVYFSIILLLITMPYGLLQVIKAREERDKPYKVRLTLAVTIIHGAAINVSALICWIFTSLLGLGFVVSMILAVMLYIILAVGIHYIAWNYQWKNP